MGRFATHEDEVDDLFRLGVFVDLYRVVRQGLRVGVENYSIKSPGTSLRLRAAGRSPRCDEAPHRARGCSRRGTAEHEQESKQVVAGYNEDDCRATLALRDWLEARRAELAERLGEKPPRPVFQEEAHATRTLRSPASEPSCWQAYPKIPWIRQSSSGRRRCSRICSIGIAGKQSRPGGATST